ncbi:MAG: hypothetical protein QM628_15125 [Propionicimonas sp.]
MWEELWGWLRHREDPQLSLSPQDLAELETAAARVAGEFAVSAPEIIVATATRLLGRRVPVRGVSSTALMPGVAELRFADGTVAIVRPEHSGDLGRLAVWLVHGKVTLLGFETAPHRVILTVVHGDHRLFLTALGVRQPS